MKLPAIATVEPLWKPITVGDESFDVLVQLPTFEEKIRDDELRLREYGDGDGERTSHRLRVAITGWKDLKTAADVPLAFSWDALQAVCVQHHSIFRQLLGIANAAFRSEGEDDEKKSDLKPNDSSEEATTQ